MGPCQQNSSCLPQRSKNNILASEFLVVIISLRNQKTKTAIFAMQKVGFRQIDVGGCVYSVTVMSIKKNSEIKEMYF